MCCYVKRVDSPSTIPVSHTPLKKVISDEAKEEYENKCWKVISKDMMGFYIEVIGNPTSSDDFMNWKTLMKKARTELKILLYKPSSSIVDIQSFKLLFSFFLKERRSIC